MLLYNLSLRQTKSSNFFHFPFPCLQVRMLADLSLVGCYNMSTVPEKKRAQLLLESAKKNLRDMAFFGLTEYQRKTQFLFERTFRLRFIRPFMQYNSTRAAGVDLDNATVCTTTQSSFCKFRSVCNINLYRNTSAITIVFNVKYTIICIYFNISFKMVKEEKVGHNRISPVMANIS